MERNRYSVPLFSRRWGHCAGLGLAALVASFGFGQIAGLEACGPAGANGPIVAFELARSPADVAALFCNESFLAAMREATWLDALAFIPAYTAFVILALVALKRQGVALARTGMALVALAGLLDQIEGGLLFAIMRDLPGDPATIGWLIPIVRAKFVLLGLATAIIGWLALRRRGLGFVAGPIIALGGLAGATLLAGDAWMGVTLSGMNVAWPVLLGCAAWWWIKGGRHTYFSPPPARVETVAKK